MQGKIHAEIAAMKGRDLTSETADHLMVEAVRKNVLPASHLPQVIEAWEKPAHPEFAPRTAWSLFNAFTEVQKSRSRRYKLAPTSISLELSGSRSRSDLVAAVMFWRPVQHRSEDPDGPQSIADGVSVPAAV